ncbi:MAG: HAMP domain-containing histidine kinase [Actinobacteria bacterium]|nr:HAMP domain-containing histidine kinase [Actinomycetota bacterium]
MRRHFLRRIGLVIAVLFLLVFGANAIVVALLYRLVGPDEPIRLLPVAAGLGTALLIGFLVVGRAVRRMAVPVGDVMEAADRLAGGDHSVRVRERGSRDLRRLARSFNAMAERLEAAEARRRDLLADLAHELRTPLSVIEGNAEAMLDGLFPADRAHIEPVLEETRVMARLLDDLETLSRAEAGALRLHRERVEAADLVEDATAAFRARAGAAGIELEARTAPGLPELDVDPVRIGQVLSNLLSNAVRHTPAGGSVVVRADPAPPAGVAFAVEDTGPGIPSDSLASVFDRFVTAADSGGAGLGLAIARSLVEAHGGTIEAANRPAGGAVLRFVIPAGTPS